jgi:hypothetical protein
MVEVGESLNEKEFSLSRNKYDLTTYAGRLYHFIDITSPLTLLYSNKDIEEATDVIKNYKKTNVICGSDKEMWKYRGIVDATVHPATEEIIPALFRVSAIAPFNIPLIYAMLQCPPSNVPGMENRFICIFMNINSNMHT